MLRLVLRPSAWLSAAFLVALFPGVPAQAQSRLDRFDERILATHNAERARLGIAPLSWSPRLAADAARWAAHLSTLPELEHDDSLEIDGENLWRGSKGAYTPEDMVTLWIDEKAAFQNGVFPDVSRSGQWEDVGHYTQVVWRDTREVGCAVARNARDDFLVCRYWPAGNWMGEAPF